ncbi:MAG: UvrD-helicase domain-containing protein [Deltaproteobacteria bacterium]|nr:UvrD-helicase domain-containing protein [Deltaproteobacteria bacterium]
MKFIADLHIHSRFSRATSRALTPESLSLWGQKKGIGVIGTGDFTHPEWVKELKEKLEDADTGLYRLKPACSKLVQGQVPSACASEPLFILSGEISTIYKKDGKTRKIHHLILMPDFNSVEKFNRALEKVGNIRSDGRPILGLDSKVLMAMMLEASDRAFLIPAHIWTPWFSLFGSKSGFDAIEECFEDLTPYIHAMETGLSSDPPMNRLLSVLDKYTLVSNSDAHSPSKLGREANIFDADLNYDSMIRAMKEKDDFIGTIEFYPEEGKYHMDGHRKCNMMLHPHDTIKNNGICPVCGRPVTVGVFHRIAELADRETPLLTKPFYSLIPLNEILSEILNSGPDTKTVETAYEKLLNELGPELDILLNRDIADIEAAGGLLLARAISRMRKGEVIKQEGYDGEYGVIRLFKDSEKHELIGQKRLFAIGATEKENRPEKNVPKGLKAKKKGLKQEEQKRFDDPLLYPLNELQQEVVLHAGTHLIINAGPGTGKTLTITHKIVKETEQGNIDPSQVLALTFTNKAALEMKQRVEALMPGMIKKGMIITTFHGFCLSVLRADGSHAGISPGFSICTESDSALLADEAAKETGAGRECLTKFKKAVSGLKFMYAAGKAPDPAFMDIIPLFDKYREKLKIYNMLDFDDLEAETLRLFRLHPETCMKYADRYKRIFVDEYQDTNLLQSIILKQIVWDGLNLICAIGDPDQSIYGFRGADMNNFRRFTADFPNPHEITLTKNYRSKDIILEAASEILDKAMPLIGTRGKGDHIRIAECSTANEEAEMVVERIEKLLGGTSHFSFDSGRVESHETGDEDLSFGDIAVLYRFNSQGDAIIEALSRAGIPFVRSGEKPFTELFPVDVFMAYIRSKVSPDNLFYRERYLYKVREHNLTPDRSKEALSKDNGLLGLIDDAVTIHNLDPSTEEVKRGVERLKEAVSGISGPLTAADILLLERGIDNSAVKGDRVAVMTMHAAKGLEWPVVFITGCEEQIIPLKIYGDCDEEEEKRLFYVGITRAKNRLILSHAKMRKINNRFVCMERSPFIDLIPAKNIKPLERGSFKRKKQEKQLNLF